MQGFSTGNKVEKFGKSKKASREQISGKRDNKKLNKPVRGLRDADMIESETF